MGAEFVLIMTHSVTLFLCFSNKNTGVRCPCWTRILICETEFLGVNVTLVEVKDENDAAFVIEL